MNEEYYPQRRQTTVRPSVFEELVLQGLLWRLRHSCSDGALGSALPSLSVDLDDTMVSWLLKESLLSVLRDDDVRMTEAVPFLRSAKKHSPVPQFSPEHSSATPRRLRWSDEPVPADISMEKEGRRRR